MAPKGIRNKPKAHEWAAERRRELPAIREAVPPERLQRFAEDPYLVDGAYVGVFAERNSENIRWAQVELLDDGQCTLHELWLDLSRHPHRTGREVWWPNKRVIEAATWVSRKEKYNEQFTNSLDSNEDEDDDEPRIAIAGLRSATFPVDIGWHPAAVDAYHKNGRVRALSDLTIRNITHINTAALIGDSRPNCEKNWIARVHRPLPWKAIWASLGTELTDATEENRWFKQLHRATYVRNRQSQAEPFGEHSFLCRLGCGCEEKMEHLPQCPFMHAFWRNIFSFLEAAGEPKPESPLMAITFNVWQGDQLGSELARATIRHAFSEMYIRFSKVDTCDQKFCDLEAIVATLHALRRALIRRAVRIQRRHAMRLHTSKPHSVPDEDAAKFSTLIDMSNDGDYQLTSVLTDSIDKYEAALKARKAAQAQAKRGQAGRPHTGRARKNKRPRQP